MNKSKIITGLCILSTLVIGLILASSLNFVSLFVDNILIYTAIIFAGLSLLMCVSLTHYLNEQVILGISIPFSVLITAGAWAGNFLARSFNEFQKQLAERAQESQGVEMSAFFPEPISPMAIAVVIVIVFNLIPLIMYLRKSS